jgi:hypothetical protein
MQRILVLGQDIRLQASDKILPNRGVREILVPSSGIEFAREVHESQNPLKKNHALRT